MLPRVCLQFVIAVFPDHTYLLFLLPKRRLFFKLLEYLYKMLKPFNLIISCRLHSLVSERSKADIVKKNGFKDSQIRGIMNKS